MHYPDLPALVADRRCALAKGPIALILIEDDIEIASTVAHHQNLGFAQIIVFCAADMALPAKGETVHRVDYDITGNDAPELIVNAIIKAAPGAWIYYSFNAEYLFFPFCETRSIAALTEFAMEERRSSILCYVIDLYAADLTKAPRGVARDGACLDRAGYYALARHDSKGASAAQQVNVYGGLRWRFEEHVPWDRRRIDRPALFRATPDLELGADHLFNDPEYNTYSCPWHHSPTAAVCSFRAAKALRRNPGSRDAIDSFAWSGSVAFTWQSAQLLDLGMMEPGQWF